MLTQRALAILLQRSDARVAHSGQLLTALSYRAVLSRGYALVRDCSGAPVHAAAQIPAGAALTLEFADGRIGVTADGAPAGAEPTGAAKPAPKRVKTVDQGTLF